MIRGEIRPGTTRFAARIARKAARLARARSESALRARRRDPARWRSPRLLWPLFTQD